jgi:lysophospholipase L1-like esterase
MSPSFRHLCLALALAACLGLPGRSRAGVTYLALGDSVTFGIDPSTPSSLVPSFGDQGFVRPFADGLAVNNGGVRPSVLNLGISGELSTSFFTGVSPPGWSTAQALNLNYPAAPTAQNDKMIASINAIHGAGDSVGFATFLIGANDLFYLFGTSDFQNATPDEQAAMIAATIGTVQSNYLMLLTELATLAPEATILLPGYWNPFPADAPEHDFYEALLGIFNPIIQADAAAFGAKFVDLHPLFEGRELELTNLGIGDTHPNQAGYAVIAGALIQAVPEPGSLVMLSAGVPGLVGYWYRRRRARV